MSIAMVAGNTAFITITEDQTQECILEPEQPWYERAICEGNKVRADVRQPQADKFVDDTLPLANEMQQHLCLLLQH